VLRLAQAERKPDKTTRWQVEADTTTMADWQPK
jgi:hypothetical protein